MAQRALTAVPAGEEVVLASDYRALEAQVRKLQRLRTAAEFNMRFSGNTGRPPELAVRPAAFGSRPYDGITSEERTVHRGATAVNPPRTQRPASG